MRVAAAQYPIDRLDSFDAFARKQSDWIAEAAARGAALAVLPEYLGCELAGLLPEPQRDDPVAMFGALQPYLAPYVELFRTLAQTHGMSIAAGTFLVETAPGRFRNRAFLVTSDGTVHVQDKLALTGYERSLQVIEPGDTPFVFASGAQEPAAATRIAIAVCYDCEFPLPVRAQVEAGARVLLVPSCTDTEAGATRVRIGCQARALENQMFVAQAVTAGEARWNPVLDFNTGRAAVYAPIDLGFPATGVLAEAAPGERWAVADLDVDALAAVRELGQVANDRDWAHQLRPSVRRARLRRP